MLLKLSWASGRYELSLRKTTESQIQMTVSGLNLYDRKPSLHQINLDSHLSGFFSTRIEVQRNAKLSQSSYYFKSLHYSPYQRRRQRQDFSLLYIYFLPIFCFLLSTRRLPSFFVHAVSYHETLNQLTRFSSLALFDGNWTFKSYLEKWGIPEPELAGNITYVKVAEQSKWKQGRLREKRINLIKLTAEFSIRTHLQSLCPQGLFDDCVTGVCLREKSWSFDFLIEFADSRVDGIYARQSFLTCFDSRNISRGKNQLW